MSAVIAGNVKSMKAFFFIFLPFFFVVVVYFCVLTTGCYFSVWFPVLCQWSVVLPGCSTGMTTCLHVGHGHASGRSLACFFPGKARRNLPLMPATCLAKSRKMTGRWIYSGKMAKGKDKPNQLLCSVSCSTPSSTSSKM